MVTALSAEGVTLTNGGASEFVPACVVVWGAGIKAAPWTEDLAKQTGTETDKLGRLVVTPLLTLPGHPEIYVAGDLAHCPGSDGQPLPALGAVAQQQGHYLAAAIQERLEGREPAVAFRYRDRGTMATIGRSSAIADFHVVRLTGFLGWLAWLFVHLMLLVEFRNRLTVFFIWAWSYISRNRYARLITRESGGQRDEF
jgi:NADH dehydrogenase